MDRTSEITKDADLFGSGKHGYTEGNGTSVPPTTIGKDALNGFQEEIVRAIELGGLTPDANDLGQLSRLAIPIGAAAYFSGATIAPAGAFTLSSIFADTGFTIGSGAITLPSWGLYQISASALIQTDYTGGGVVIGLTIIVNGVSQGLVLARRFSSTAADKLGVSGTILVDFPSGTKSLAVHFNNDARGGGGSGDRADVAASEGYLSVLRLRSYE